MNFGSSTLATHPLGPLTSEILQAALDAVRPQMLVRRWAEQHLRHAGSVRVLAMGKAAGTMAEGLRDALGDRLAGGVVVTKQPFELDGLEVFVGDHPVPSQASVRAGEALLAAAPRVAPNETLVALISGGASALAEAPAEGTTLEDIARHTHAKLRDATTIEELNSQRRRLSRLKGGGLARVLPPGVTVHAAVLSDVLGGDVHAVGSGPFDDPRVLEHLLGDNDTAVQAAAQAARVAGAEVEVLPPLRGEARIEGVRWAHARMQGPPTDAVRCTIAGAETVVTVRGEGSGGRNQEFALAAAPAFMGHPHALLASLATDGEDGPTDAAGAVVDGTTVTRALERGLDLDAHLRRNDAYPFFESLGDLLRPGPTGTNVCDVVVTLS